jgi:hypothetical protein
MCRTNAVYFSNCNHVHHICYHCPQYGYQLCGDSSRPTTVEVKDELCSSCKIIGPLNDSSRRRIRARVLESRLLSTTQAYDDIQARTKEPFIKQMLIRLHFTLNLYQKSGSEAPGSEQMLRIRAARMDIWSEFIPRLSSRYKFEYSEDEVDFEFLPGYQARLEDVIDILIFHPRTVELEAIFQERQEARALRLEDLPEDQNECAICLDRYNWSDLVPCAETETAQKFASRDTPPSESPARNSWSSTAILRKIVVAFVAWAKGENSDCDPLPGQDLVKCSPVQLLPCRHILCRSCLDKWFRRDNTCPWCRHSYRPSIFEIWQSEDPAVEDGTKVGDDDLDEDEVEDDEEEDEDNEDGDEDDLEDVFQDGLEFQQIEPRRGLQWEAGFIRFPI